MLGFPMQGSGLLVSGGSMANLVGINVARSALASFPVREQGLTDRARLMLYASSETHNSVQKAAELMGLGSQSLAKIPVDSDYRIDVAARRGKADRQILHLEQVGHRAAPPLSGRRTPSAARLAIVASLSSRPRAAAATLA